MFDTRIAIMIATSVIFFVGLVYTLFTMYFDLTTPASVIAFCMISLPISMHYLQKRYTVDTIFMLTVNWILFTRIILNTGRSEIPVDIASVYFLPLHSGTHIQIALIQLTICVSVWFLVRSIFKFNTFDLKSLRMHDDSQLVRVSIFFIICVVTQIYLTINYSFNTAGVETRVANQGIFYYLFPVDLLILPLVVILHLSSIKSRNIVLITVIGLYIALKTAQGWKVSIALIALLFFSLELAQNKWKVRIRALFFYILAYLLFTQFFSTAVTQYRLARINGVDDFFEAVLSSFTIADAKNNFSLYDRLSENTDYALAYIDRSIQGSITSQIKWYDLFFELFDRLNPFYSNQSVSFHSKFSITFLGQNANDINQFGTSVLGTGYIISPLFGTMLYTAFFASVYSLILLLSKRSKLSVMLRAFYVGTSLTITVWVIGGGLGPLVSIIIATIYLSALMRLEHIIFGKKNVKIYSRTDKKPA